MELLQGWMPAVAKTVPAVGRGGGVSLKVQASLGEAQG